MPTKKGAAGGRWRRAGLQAGNILLLGAVVSQILGALTAPAAAASRHRPKPASPLKMTVKAGYDQRYAASGIPVSVTLESTRAIRGDLEVSSQIPDGGRVVHAMRVEVPAGGKKAFDLFVPLLTVSPQLPRLDILVREGRQVYVQQETNLLPADDALRVGLLFDAVPPALAGIRAEPTGAEVRGVVVPEAWVKLGRRAMEPLSYIVADAGRLRGLAPGLRQHLLDWVVSGGRLLVAARTPQDLDWLPESGRSELAGGKPLLGGRATYLQAGLGEVIVVSEALGALSQDKDFWQKILRPSRFAITRPDLGGFDQGIDFDLINNLARRLGGSIRLSWFIFFLLAYLVAVGPANYLLLRRMRRREMAWVTIPALSLAFTFLAYGLARGTRGGLALQQASVVFSTEEGQAGRRLATVSSGAGGTRTVGFASPDATAPWLPGPPAPERRLLTRLTGSGAEVIIETSPFSIGLAQEDLQDSPGILDAALSWDGRALSGTVTNRTGLALSEVRVTDGIRSANVGKLAPGASKGISLSLDRPLPLGPEGPFIEPEPIDWNNPESVVRFRLFSSLRPLLARMFLGVPLAVGYTEEFAPPLRLDGQPRRPPGPTLVASPARVEVPAGASGVLPATLGRSELVKIDGGVSIGDPSGTISIHSFSEAVFAYRLPKGVDLARISRAVLRVGAGGGQPGGFEVQAYNWKSRSWMDPVKVGAGPFVVPGKGAFFEGRPVPPAPFPVPPADGLGANHELPKEVISEAGEVFFRLTPGAEPYAQLWLLGLEVTLA
ncbi:MAG: hypothetical protein ACRDIF_06685 [Actinomycetota bacterium]